MPTWDIDPIHNAASADNGDIYDAATTIACDNSWFDVVVALGKSAHAIADECEARGGSWAEAFVEEVYRNFDAKQNANALNHAMHPPDLANQMPQQSDGASNLLRGGGRRVAERKGSTGNRSVPLAEGRAARLQATVFDAQTPGLFACARPRARPCLGERNGAPVFADTTERSVFGGARARLAALETNGDGACGLHASFGVPSGGELICPACPRVDAAAALRRARARSCRRIF